MNKVELTDEEMGITFLALEAFKRLGGENFHNWGELIASIDAKLTAAAQEEDIRKKELCHE